MIVINSKPQHLRFVSASTTNTAYYSSSMVNWQLTTCSQGWHLPTDIFETEENIIIKTEIPGMDERDFKIFAEPSSLVINGTRRDDCELLRAYHQMEIRYGEFYLNIDLPLPVIVDEISAIYQNGLLLITLPKANPHKNSFIEG